MNKYTIGQTWISETEPELGICRVLNAEFKRLTVHFPTSDETRIYSLENAPLIRVLYQIGDTLNSENSKSLEVKNIREKNGLMFYSDGENEYIETILTAEIDYSDAISRLNILDFDSREMFDLRNETLKIEQQTKSSKYRGLSGGRMELLPHQLYVVNTIASSHDQRVLLADEVGLGKTIEACLLLHRFILTGEISRALIIVPDHLVHQWFIELYSRFNLVFDILDKARHDTFEQNSSLLICGLDFLMEKPEVALKITHSDWDMLIVDEVHHLVWNDKSEKCIGYNIVKILSEAIEKVILLSATPEQLGLEGHFARLQLLDPNRYYDLKQFINEQKSYAKAAKLADKLINNKKLTSTEQKLISSIMQQNTIRESKKEDNNNQNKLNTLIDHYGTGRAIYRNTRHVIKGFPKRIALLEEITTETDSPFHQTLKKEFEYEYCSNNKKDQETEKSANIAEFNYNFDGDPRLLWLSKKLKKLKDEKFLLICHSKEKIIAIKEALLKIENFKIVLFHEDMTVINRDRGAAWFSQKDGAKILLCSEIGSEGRNFQFAHHLILFDLPLNPELLEQRIGRLDRIGQKNDISIHIPYLKNSPQQVLNRWYHEGLNMIEHHLSAGHEFLKPFANKLIKLAMEQNNHTKVDKLIAETRIFRDKLIKQLENGRDYLLELNSFDANKAKELVKKVQSIDKDKNLDAYILKALDQFRVGVEIMSNRSYLLSPANALISLPWLKNEDIEVTCSRRKALEREEISFLTWDHPLTTGIIDSIIGSTFGNCSFVIMKSDTTTIMVETWFIIECQAPKHLHIDRFIAPQPVRVLIDHNNNDLTATLKGDKFLNSLSDGKKHLLAENPMIIKQIVPRLLKSATKIVTKQAEKVIKKSIERINKELDLEIARLIPLQKINHNIKSEEIELLIKRKEEIITHVKKYQTRLDSLSIIFANSKKDSTATS